MAEADIHVDIIPPYQAFPSAWQMARFERQCNEKGPEFVKSEIERLALVSLANGIYNGLEGTGPASRYNYLARKVGARPIGELRDELPHFIRQQQMLIIDLAIARRASAYFSQARPA